MTQFIESAGGRTTHLFAAVESLPEWVLEDTNEARRQKNEAHFGGPVMAVSLCNQTHPVRTVTDTRTRQLCKNCARVAIANVLPTNKSLDI